VYGLAADGLTAWELGTDGYGIMPAGMRESVIKDFRVWHTYEGAIYNYPSHRMTVDGHQQGIQNLYGGLAPCPNTTARAEIDGITCPMTGSPPGTKPATPTGLRIVR
jgi:hypothetical protein